LIILALLLIERNERRSRAKNSFSASRSKHKRAFPLLFSVCLFIEINIIMIYIYKFTWNSLEIQWTMRTIWHVNWNLTAIWLNLLNGSQSSLDLLLGLVEKRSQKPQLIMCAPITLILNYGPKNEEAIWMDSTGTVHCMYVSRCAFRLLLMALDFVHCILLHRFYLISIILIKYISIAPNS